LLLLLLLLFLLRFLLSKGVEKNVGLIKYTAVVLMCARKKLLLDA